MLFWVCLWGCFKMRLTFEWYTEWSRLLSPVCGGTHPPNVDLNKTKRRIRLLSLIVFELLYRSSLVLGLECTLSAFLVPWPSVLDGNYTTGPAGSSGYRQQIMEFLRLHNHVSQLLIINHICIVHTCIWYMYIYVYDIHIDHLYMVCMHTHIHTHVYISYWFCFSVQPWIIQTLLYICIHICGKWMHYSANYGLYIGKTGFKSLALPLTDCVTSGKLLNIPRL